MSTLERAIALAAEAHEGQVDKAGAPYILHVLRVVIGSPPGAAQIVAALHDVVEDTDLMLDDLRERGFEESVLDAVDAMTRRAGETYADFIERAGADPLARDVKMADLRDNSDLSRLSAPTEADRSRTARYDRSMSRLLTLGAGWSIL